MATKLGRLSLSFQLKGKSGEEKAARRKFNFAISYDLTPTSPGGLGLDQPSDAMLHFPAPSKHTSARTRRLSLVKNVVERFSFLRRCVNALFLKRVALIKTFPSISYALDKPIPESGARSSSRNRLGNGCAPGLLGFLAGHFLCSQFGDLPCARQETAIRLAPWGAQRMLIKACPLHLLPCASRSTGSKKPHLRHQQPCPSRHMLNQTSSAFTKAFVYSI